MIMITLCFNLTQLTTKPEQFKHCQYVFQNSSSLLQGLMAPVTTNNNQAPKSPPKPAAKPSPSSVIPKKEDKAAWFKLFAELDPLANPDNLPGSNSSHSHAA